MQKKIIPQMRGRGKKIKAASLELDDNGVYLRFICLLYVFLSLFVVTAHAYTFTLTYTASVQRDFSTSQYLSFSQRRPSSEGTWPAFSSTSVHHLCESLQTQSQTRSRIASVERIEQRRIFKMNWNKKQQIKCEWKFLPLHFAGFNKLMRTLVRKRIENRWI